MDYPFKKLDHAESGVDMKKVLARVSGIFFLLGPALNMYISTFREEGL